MEQETVITIKDNATSHMALSLVIIGHTIISSAHRYHDLKTSAEGKKNVQRDVPDFTPTFYSARTWRSIAPKGSCNLYTSVTTGLTGSPAVRRR